MPLRDGSPPGRGIAFYGIKSHIPHHIHEVLKGIGTLHGLLVKHHEIPVLPPRGSFPCLAQFQLAPGIGVVPVVSLGLDGKEDTAFGHGEEVRVVIQEDVDKGDD